MFQCISTTNWFLIAEKGCDSSYAMLYASEFEVCAVYQFTSVSNTRNAKAQQYNYAVLLLLSNKHGKEYLVISGVSLVQFTLSP